MPLAQEGGAEGGPDDAVGEARLGTLYWANLNLEQIQELNAHTPVHEYQALCNRVTKLELFMFSLSDVKHLRDYPNLHELSLHLQTLPPKPSISEMHRLTRMCLTE
eukprot:7075244-Prymnesium_polylepis.1